MLCTGISDVSLHIVCKSRFCHFYDEIDGDDNDSLVSKHSSEIIRHIMNKLDLVRNWIDPLHYSITKLLNMIPL